MQLENHQTLVEAGVKRWEIGEIAVRIAEMYYEQYWRTSDSACLSQAFAFYEVILDGEYFEWDGDEKSEEERGTLLNKKLRFVAKFLTVSIIAGRKEMSKQLKDLIKKIFMGAEYREWMHVVQEVAMFLKADSSDMRPLRYNPVYDSHPDFLIGVVSCKDKRRRVLSAAILSSYCHNEAKVSDITFDTFRMLQSLEWESRGVVSLKGGSYDSSIGTGLDCANAIQETRDASRLSNNPWKVILQRPSVTHFLMVLSTICEELPPDGILLLYFSASEEPELEKTSEVSGCEKTSAVGSPPDSPMTSIGHSSRNIENQNENHDNYSWLGSRVSKGSSYLYPCDLIPFTRKPLFLVIDSKISHDFKVIHGQEIGETAAMLLSPSAQVPPSPGSSDFTRGQGSQFTMFLTAPLEAFCSMIGISDAIDTDTYEKADKVFCLSLKELETALVISDCLHPVWVDVLGDPFLRRLTLRFLFCRAVLALYLPTSGQSTYIPSCQPELPDSVSPKESTYAVWRLAHFLGVIKQFDFTKPF